jgi:type I restriction enzyme R subunit
MAGAEARTRAHRIDPRIKQAGWNPILEYSASRALDRLQSTAIKELPTANGPADYALCDRGNVLGVVEAKKLTLGPQGVLPQAERYSRGIDQQPKYQGEFGVPFLYSTNGEVIHFHDVRDAQNRSREVKGFHTLPAFREMLARDRRQELANLSTIPLNDTLRPYQIDANQAIEGAIADGQRKMMVAMATGTGKTRTMVNETYRLMKAGVARRVLFLVDRKALANQTVKAFASFEAEPGLRFNKIYDVYSQRFQQDELDEDAFDDTVLPAQLLQTPKLGDTFVYVATIQRIAINLFGKAAVFDRPDEAFDTDADVIENTPLHAFDLIIADECHRGYSAKEVSTWRDTLDYFDAIKIGLTATPAAHTSAYFGTPVYRYDYERAVREGYLVDYDVVSLRSNVRMDGVFLSEGETVDVVDPVSGAKQLDLLEDERAFDASKVEREITAPDSNRKILEEIKHYCDEHEAATGRFPKTLIFAANDLPHTSHADQLVAQAREIFNRGEAFVAKITGRVDRPLQRIREFRNRPNPGIAVTVDLLTTGVDIPDLEFLVFLRPVKSRILFEQMLGRGTRHSNDLVPPKTHFVVFDCFDGTLLEYFRETTGMTVEPPQTESKPLAQVIEDIWQNRDRAYNIKRLTKRLQRIDKELTGEARELFAGYISDGDLGRFARELEGNLQSDFVGTMQLLRLDQFQKLLTDYPRAPRTFIVAGSATDTVTSLWLIRGAQGKEYKPEDYLQAFTTFVQENQTEIEALAVLLGKPQDWSAETLRELRAAMLLAPEHFDEAKLQKAMEQSRHKALVDIISMVKAAADASSPLLTVQERVDAAIARSINGRTLTPAQEKWMQRIREHLVANLSIERDDFEYIPVLADFGGWGRANKDFNGDLTMMIQTLNRELVAA